MGLPPTADERRAWSWLVDLRPGEGRRAALGFLFFFLAITGYYVLKPARDSLFLEHLGAKLLPVYYLASPVLILAAARLYQGLVDRLSRPGLLLAVYGTAIACLAVFWALYEAAVPWATSAFFLWLAVFNLFVVLVVWTLVNDVFTAAEGKRLYGFIGAGGIAGGVAGGWTAQRLAVGLGTHALLLVGAAIWAAGAGAGIWLHRTAPRAAVPTDTGAEEAAGTRPETPGLFADPYARWIALVVAGGTYLGTLFDLEFKRVVGDALALRDDRTAYFGYLQYRMNLVGVLVQAFVTPFVHKTWGPGAGLAFLPASFVAAIAMLIGSPSLGALGLVSILIGGLAYSINQSSRELLYVPTSRAFRYKAKAILDTVFFRVGDGVASALKLACEAAQASTLWLLAPGGAVLVAWFFGAWRLEREFRKRTKDQ